MSRRHRIEIPAGSPFFLGHFPGHPILPGIAHLHLVAQALAEESGSSGWIAEIPSLKLRHPVRPVDVLDLDLRGPGDDGIVRFELRRGEDLVSTGSLGIRSGGAQALSPGNHPWVQGRPVASLIPHEPPARLLRDVLDTSDGTLTGLAEIPADSPFVADGRAPAFLGLEAAAQGAAVLEALSRPEAPGPRIGYLVGLRDARFQIPRLSADRPFRVALRLTGSAPPLSIYDAIVEAGPGIELARGTLSTYVLPPG